MQEHRERRGVRAGSRRPATGLRSMVLGSSKTMMDRIRCTQHLCMPQSCGHTLTMRECGKGACITATVAAGRAPTSCKASLNAAPACWPAVLHCLTQDVRPTAQAPGHKHNNYGAASCHAVGIQQSAQCQVQHCKWWVSASVHSNGSTLEQALERCMRCVHSTTRSIEHHSMLRVHRKHRIQPWLATLPPLLWQPT